MKRALLILFSLFLLAYFLRVLYLPQLALTFGYDQARDAFNAQQILAGDLKILGPPASTPGLYHGALYFYVLAPGYLIGHGNPIVAAYWIALLNALTIFTVFYLTFLLTKKLGAAILASLFFAVSFEATQYATWLSNPTLGVWTVPLIYLGMWAWIKERKLWGAIVAGLGLGMSAQAEVFLLYHTVPVLLWMWIGKTHITKKQLIGFALALLLSLSTMIVAEIKFGFKGLSGVAQLATTQDAIVASKGLGDFLLLYFNQLGRVFSYNSYPGNVGYGGVLILALIAASLIQWKKGSVSWEPFLAVWLLCHITVVSLGGTSTPFLLVGIGPAVSILLGIFIYKWWNSGLKGLAVVVLCIVIFGNLTMILKENKKGQTIFAIQHDMVITKQLPAIDYTYKAANGEKFSINSLTSPLYINIVWTYLYKWYGLEKYGYIPEWHGHDQIGQIDSLSKVNPKTLKYFLILEPLNGIPQHFLSDTVAEEDGFSATIGEENFGELVIQNRKKL